MFNSSITCSMGVCCTRQILPETNSQKILLIQSVLVLLSLISIAVCDSSLKRKQQWTIYFDEPNAEKMTGSKKCHLHQSKSSEMKPPLLQLKQLCLAVTGLALLGLYVRFVSKSHLGLYLLCLSLYVRFVSRTHFGLYVLVSMSGSYLSPMSQSPSQE